MEQVIEREALIKKYLLGDLPEEKQVEVEIRLLTDKGYFNELLLVEDEITEGFLFGTLTEHEQERTRNYFLAVPERRQKLLFAKALEQYASASALAREHAFASAPAVVADKLNESTLAEAHRNRDLLGSLIDGDWMGLHLLVLLRETPRSELELASRMRVLDEARVTPILTRLILSDVIEEDEGLFFCTALGLETLRQIEEKSGVQFTP